MSTWPRDAECCQDQPGSALFAAWRPQPLAFVNTQGAPAGEACYWAPRRLGRSHGLAGSSLSTWTTEQVIGLTSWPQGCVERQAISWPGCGLWGRLPGSACQLGDLRQIIHLSELHFPFIENGDASTCFIHTTCIRAKAQRAGAWEVLSTGPGARYLSSTGKLSTGQTYWVSPIPKGPHWPSLGVPPSLTSHGRKYPQNSLPTSCFPCVLRSRRGGPDGLIICFPQLTPCLSDIPGTRVCP